MSDLDVLIPRPTSPPPSFRFATVTGVSPARVRLDGDTDPVASTPTLLSAVEVSDRVLVVINARQLIVLGVVQ